MNHDNQDSSVSGIGVHGTTKVAYTRDEYRQLGDSELSGVPRTVCGVRAIASSHTWICLRTCTEVQNTILASSHRSSRPPLLHQRLFSARQFAYCVAVNNTKCSALRRGEGLVSQCPIAGWLATPMLKWVRRRLGQQEAQLSLRDRATRACQLKSGKVLHKCRRLVFEKL